MSDPEKLQNLVLAPYILKATGLISLRRHVGGNQFRHAMATLAILLDYKLFDDYVLLKASVIHDLIEDIPETNENELRQIDYQGNAVVDLVLEVTRKKGIQRTHYLKNILENGSRNAKLIKIADRISNLTDLHRDHYSRKKMIDNLNESEKYILPMAMQVNADMVKELTDLIKLRRSQLNYFKFPGFRFFKS
jgi:(p)ppGpp synthase/HD superfamily hydrolase